MLRHLWRLLSDSGYRAWRADKKAYRAAHGQGMPETYTGVLPGDIALEIGALHGDWADAMIKRYAVSVHVFVPQKQLASDVSTRFENRADIEVHGAGKGSLFSDVTTVLSKPDIDRVAVAKVNLGGTEYDMLDALLDAGLMERIDRLNIRFYNAMDGDRQRRDHIRTRLAETHDCVWCYPFIWEEWHRQGLGV